MNRDDFKKTTKTLLAKRVGYRCSNPKCRKVTIGPHTKLSQSVNVGVAAHITAAAPSGPRHAPELTREQRSSAKNGIWLCQTCAKLIDCDDAVFTVERLELWKLVCEQMTLGEIENSGITETVANTLLEYCHDLLCEHAKHKQQYHHYVLRLRLASRETYLELESIRSQILLTQGRDFLRLCGQETQFIDTCKPADEWFSGFLSSEHPTVAYIVGEYGSGKSNLAMRLAANLAQEYIKKPEESPFPVYLKMQDFDVEPGISREAIWQWVAKRLGTKRNFVEFLKHLDQRKLILFLDGIDEIPTTKQRTRTAELCIFGFKELMRSCGRMVVFGRTAFHQTDEYIVGLVGAEGVRSKLYDNIFETRENAEVCYVCDLGQKDVADYLQSRFGTAAGEIKRKLGEFAGLNHLAGRPLLLDMIAKSFEVIRTLDSDVRSYELYEVFIKRHWHVERERGRLRVPDTHIEIAMESLAQELHLSRRHSTIHYSKLPNLRQELFRFVRGPSLASEYDHALQCCSFLARDSSGHYSFSHHSFGEYFASRKIVRQLKDNDISILDNKEVLSDQICEFSGEQLSEVPDLGQFLHAASRNIGFSDIVRRSALKLRNQTARYGGPVRTEVKSIFANELNAAGQSRLVKSTDILPGFRECRIPVGEYWIGGEVDSDRPTRINKLTKSIWMAETLITNEQWAEIMKTVPSYFGDNATHPVETISWENCIDFCNRLSRCAGLTPAYSKGESNQRLDHATGFFIPSSDEWEIACRASSSSDFIVGNDIQDLDAVAWYNGNSEGRTHEVRLKSANPWGLFDTLGNVWEWCENSVIIPSPDNVSQLVHRMIKGGAWSSEACNCRCVSEHTVSQHVKSRKIGIRIARFQ